LNKSKTSTFSPHSTRFEIIVNGYRMIVVPGGCTAGSRPPSSSTITHSLFWFLNKSITEDNPKTLQLAGLIRFAGICLKNGPNGTQFAGRCPIFPSRGFVGEKFLNNRPLVAQSLC
jgi:hypothetical protein